VGKSLPNALKIVLNPRRRKESAFFEQCWKRDAKQRLPDQKGLAQASPNGGIQSAA
jgi:hypothetical protein